MKKEASDEKEDATIFPPLPSLKSDLDFRLMQVVNLKADAWSNTADRVFCGHLGGMAARKGPAFYEGVEVLRTAKVWIPLSEGHDEKKSRGQWKQEVTFTSSFTLTCPPGFETETLTVKVCTTEILALQAPQSKCHLVSRIPQGQLSRPR